MYLQKVTRGLYLSQGVKSPGTLRFYFGLAELMTAVHDRRTRDPRFHARDAGVVPQRTDPGTVGVWRQRGRSGRVSEVLPRGFPRVLRWSSRSGLHRGSGDTTDFTKFGKKIKGVFAFTASWNTGVTQD